MNRSHAIAAALLIAASSLAIARPVTSGRAIGPRATVTDLSARKKRPAPLPANSAPDRLVARPWTGSDPSRGPGQQQLREFQREGRCVIDEGYGRYTFCDNP
jgi:hypothetical protein